MVLTSNWLQPYIVCRTANRTGTSVRLSCANQPPVLRPWDVEVASGEQDSPGTTN